MLYNTNSEKEQIKLLSNLFALLTISNINLNKQFTMAGDFNLFFNSKLDAAGRNLTLKKRILLNLSNLRKLMTYVISGK